MPSMNGTTSADPLPATQDRPLSPAKKKRPNSRLTSSQTGGEATGSCRPSAFPLESRIRAVYDIVQVLQSHDPDISILHYSPATRAAREPSSEPAQKRTKLSVTENEDTIASKAARGHYNSFEELQRDIRYASSKVLDKCMEKSRPNKYPANLSYRNVLPDDSKCQSQVLAFQKLARTLIDRELMCRDEPAKGRTLTNGETQNIKEEENYDETADRLRDVEDERPGGTVLTLYGQAQGPKQLFSSLQQPTTVCADGRECRPDPVGTVEISLPISEIVLPNGVSTTKIVPAYVDENTRVPSFGEVFGPTSYVPQLNPPKSASAPHNRGTTITWGETGSTKSSSRKTYYPSQKLSTAQWLGYSGVSVPQEPSSPGLKRKQRERALSTGEAKPAISETENEAIRQAKEEALFRGAFSSFAPSMDGSNAIVPEEVKNQVWWHRVGAKRFACMDIDLTGVTYDYANILEDLADGQAIDEEEEFRKAVDLFTPDDLDSKCNTEGEAGKHEKESMEILEEISQLLETLYSYQRNRLASLSSPQRPGSAGGSMKDMAGRIADPSSAEVDTYKLLRDHLAVVISQLPPHAVAKLNGDYLAELNISQRFLIRGEKCRGVMEEDHVTRSAKHAAWASANVTASQKPQHSAHAPSYTSNQYARNAISASSRNNQGYFPQQQPPNRTPSNFSTRSFPSSGQPAAGSKSYPQIAAYGQSSSRPQVPVLKYKTHYPPAPARQIHNRSSSNSGPSYPMQNHQQNTPNLKTNSSPYTRSLSPQKPTGYQPPRYPSYTNATSTSSTSSSQPRPSPSKLPTHKSTQSSLVGPSGFHSASLSDDQQKMMMERQRTQLAAQSQARNAVQAQVSRYESGTLAPKLEGLSKETNGNSGSAATNS